MLPIQVRSIYLVLVGHIEILPALFDNVIMPSVVRDELCHPKAAPKVRDWISSPALADMRSSTGGYAGDAFWNRLDAREKDAIALAIELHADLLLMDDEEGVIAARRTGPEVTGTLGVLGRASQLREEMQGPRCAARYNPEAWNLIWSAGWRAWLRLH